MIWGICGNMDIRFDGLVCIMFIYVLTSLARLLVYVLKVLFVFVILELLLH